jgi:hypothetical protein
MAGGTSEKTGILRLRGLDGVECGGSDDEDAHVQIRSILGWIATAGTLVHMGNPVQWRRFGRVSGRLDDAGNFFPMEA